MTFALVANTGAASANASDVTTSPGIDTTGANLIVIEAAWFSTLTSVTDNKGNTYTALNSGATGGARKGQLFYCVNPTVGSGHTFTLTAGFPSICVAAFSGSAASPVDGDVANPNQNPGSVTPSEDNELLVSALCHSDGTGNAFSGFTVTDDNADSGLSVGSTMTYQIQTTATTVNQSWSPGSNARASLASFKTAAGGTTFNVSLSDKYAINADTFARIANGNRSISDNWAESDAVSRRADAFRQLSDNYAEHDTASRIANAFRTTADNYAIADAVTRIASAFRLVSDNYAIGDLASLLLVTPGIAVIRVSDFLAIADAVSRKSDANRTLSDLFALADAASRQANALRSLADLFAVTDAVARGQQHARLVSDSYALVDDVTLIVTGTVVAIFVVDLLWRSTSTELLWRSSSEDLLWDEV